VVLTNRPGYIPPQSLCSLQTLLSQTSTSLVSTQVLCLFTACCVAAQNLFIFIILNIFKRGFLQDRWRDLNQTVHTDGRWAGMNRQGSVLVTKELSHARSRSYARHSTHPDNARSSSFFSGSLQLHCKFRYSHKMLSVCCRLSVTRGYCDKTAKARFMQFSLSVAQYLNSLPAKFDYQIRRGSCLSGAQTGFGWFLTSRCYTSEAVRINHYRKSYMGFRLQQMWMTSNDLERQSSALLSELCVFWPNGWG